MIKMGELRDVQTANINNLLVRDERMEQLLEKVEAMQEEIKPESTPSSMVNSNAGFVNKVKATRRQKCWQSLGFKLFSAVVVLALLYVLIAFLGCGFTFEKCI